jgi:hypothetical protein
VRGWMVSTLICMGSVRTVPASARNQTLVIQPVASLTG